MTDRERIELETLIELEAASKRKFSCNIMPTCGCVEYEGKLITVEEYKVILSKYAPRHMYKNKELSFFMFVCASGEDCKQGKYRPVTESERRNGYLLRDDPHCRCYEGLKQQYGDDLPEVARQYGREQYP